MFEAIPGYSLFDLKKQTHRHLNLPRAANGLIGDSQAGHARAGIEARIGSITTGRLRRGTGNRKGIEAHVLLHFTDGDIEARRIREIEYIERKRRRKTVA